MSDDAGSAQSDESASNAMEATPHESREEVAPPVDPGEANGRVVEDGNTPTNTAATESTFVPAPETEPIVAAEVEEEGLAGEGKQEHATVVASANDAVDDSVSTPSVPIPAPVAEQPRVIEKPRESGVPSAALIPAISGAVGLAARRAKRAARIERIYELKKLGRPIHNNDVQLLLHVSHKTASTYLNALVIAGKLFAEGKGKGRVYRFI